MHHERVFSGILVARPSTSEVLAVAGAASVATGSVGVALADENGIVLGIDTHALAVMEEAGVAALLEHVVKLPGGPGGRVDLALGHALLSGVGHAVLGGHSGDGQDRQQSETQHAHFP